MAKPHFTPRRQECPLCNAIMMVSFGFLVRNFRIREFKIWLESPFQSINCCSFRWFGIWELTYVAMHVTESSMHPNIIRNFEQTHLQWMTLRTLLYWINWTSFRWIALMHGVLLRWEIFLKKWFFQSFTDYCNNSDSYQNKRFTTGRKIWEISKTQNPL